jgi:hypothetical protein
MMTLRQRLHQLEARVRPAALPLPVAIGSALELWQRVIRSDPDPWQQEVLLSESKRVLLLCARQSGKSSVASVCAISHALSHAGALVLLLSPSLRQSVELGRKVFESYRRLGRPVSAETESKLTLELTNDSRIIALPGADEGTVRGFSGVTLLILDEASRCQDDLYRACRPMVSVSQGKILMLSTPYGRRGFFYDTWRDAPGWLKIEVPASRCPRLTPEFLEEEKAALGPSWYRQEYECSFEDTADVVFDYDLVHAALDPTVKPLFSPDGRLTEEV